MLTLDTADHLLRDIGRKQIDKIARCAKSFMMTAYNCCPLSVAVCKCVSMRLLREAYMCASIPRVQGTCAVLCTYEHVLSSAGKKHTLWTCQCVSVSSFLAE